MSIIIWVSKNWKLILTVLTVMFLLSLVSPITLMLRRTKEGMKEALTPLGFVVLLIIINVNIKIPNYVYERFPS